MDSFVCELVAARPDGPAVVAERQVFLAPTAAMAIDRANHWAAMEPWLADYGTHLRLTVGGRPVWTRRLPAPRRPS